jgi:protein ImuB
MFACIYIPDFPVQASLLPEPAGTRTALNRAPIVVLDGPANLPRVFATNPAARRAGIHTGMTKLQAEVCTGIVLRKRSLAEEESAQSALLDSAAAFSPRVESTAPGAAILDLMGTEKLFAQQKDSQKNGRQSQPWSRALFAIITKATAAGFNVRIALASNPDTAFLAARGFPANTIIPTGEEAQHLSPLPIETLPLPPEILETLNNWGIRTFQSLAALPAVAVVERLGQSGLYLQKLARGAIFRPLLTIEPNTEFVTEFEFDDPVETLESIFFILNRLLHDLCSRLISVAQAASELRLTIGLNVRQIQHTRRDAACCVSPEQDDQSTHVWKLPTPTQDKNLLFKLIRLHLEKIAFSAPVSRLKLEVIPVKPRLVQGCLFAPPSPEPEKLEITLERIRGVVGSTDAEGIACVGSPHIPDTHRPGSFLLQHFLVETQLAASLVPSVAGSDNLGKIRNHRASHPERSSAIRAADRTTKSELRRLHGVRAARRNPEQTGVPSTPAFGVMGWGSRGSLDPYHSPKSQKSSPAIALRIFRPALETSVELDGEKPHFVRLWSRHRRVIAASGPWSTSGNWWNASTWMREEWDVALKTSAGPCFYRIYRDRLQDRWFVEGVFD